MVVAEDKGGVEDSFSFTAKKLYTPKSYHLTHYGYSKLIIVYHDGTCELIRMIIMQFWS